MNRSRRRFVIGAAAGLIALGAGGAFVLRTHAGPPAPRLEIERTTWSFAGADSNTDVPCTFTLRNAGRAPLVFKNVHADCTCTHAGVDRALLAPGETTVLRATYHTPERTGRAGANIAIETNDPTRPTALVRIEGTIRPVLQLVPGTLYLEGPRHPAIVSSPGALPEVTRSADVWAWGDRPVTVDEVKASADWLEARFVPEPQRPGPHEHLGQIIARARGKPVDGDGAAEIKVTARAGDRVLRRTMKVVVDVD